MTKGATLRDHMESQKMAREKEERELEEGDSKLRKQIRRETSHEFVIY